MGIGEDVAREEVAGHIIGYSDPDMVSDERVKAATADIQQALDAVRADQHAKTWAMAMAAAKHELQGWANLSRANNADMSKAYEYAADKVAAIPCPPLEQEGV